MFRPSVALLISASLILTGTAQAQETTEQQPVIDDFDWLAGSWQCEAMGGKCEEVWNPPSAGTMMGMFKFYKDGQVVFYELMTLVEGEDGIEFRLKHFGPDLIGWESKEESVEFPFVSVSQAHAEFKGISFERLGLDEIKITVAQKEGELVFDFERAAPANEYSGKPTQPKLREELIEMEDKDQEAREAMIQAMGAAGFNPSEPDSGSKPEVIKAMMETQKAVLEIDRVNRDRLREIVSEHGWPGATLVGKDGASAAWLLTQHADSDRDFQKEMLNLMKLAHPGEVEAKNIAYLVDRVLVGEGKPQWYGTQMGNDFQPDNIEFPEDVNRRRAAVGMGTLEEYLEFAKASYQKMAEQPEADADSSDDQSSDKESDQHDDQHDHQQKR